MLTIPEKNMKNVRSDVAGNKMREGRAIQGNEE